MLHIDSAAKCRATSAKVIAPAGERRVDSQKPTLTSCEEGDEHSVALPLKMEKRGKTTRRRSGAMRLQIQKIESNAAGGGYRRALSTSSYLDSI